MNVVVNESHLQDHHGPKYVELGAIKIELADKLSDKMKAVLSSGEYERDELSIVQRTLQKTDKVLEIGTGIGLISSYCARKIGSDRVYTFEANPELEEFIRRTFTINNVSPSLQICLLAHSEGNEVFHIADDFWGSSTRDLGPAARPILVPKRVFNEELERIKPTYLILDIEGGEYDLLLKADLHHVNKILMELHTFFIGNDKANEILSYLSSCGFRVNRKITYAQCADFSNRRRMYEYARHVCESNDFSQRLFRSIEKLKPNYSDVFHGNLFLERVVD